MTKMGLMKETGECTLIFLCDKNEMKALVESLENEKANSEFTKISDFNHPDNHYSVFIHEDKTFEIRDMKQTVNDPDCDNISGKIVNDEKFIEKMKNVDKELERICNYGLAFEDKNIRVFETDIPNDTVSPHLSTENDQLTKATITINTHDKTLTMSVGADVLYGNAIDAKDFCCDMYGLEHKEDNERFEPFKKAEKTYTIEFPDADNDKLHAEAIKLYNSLTEKYRELSRSNLYPNIDFEKDTREDAKETIEKER